jgi:hypothetical protein
LTLDKDVNNVTHYVSSRIVPTFSLVVGTSTATDHVLRLHRDECNLLPYREVFSVGECRAQVLAQAVIVGPSLRFSNPWPRNQQAPSLSFIVSDRESSAMMNGRTLDAKATSAEAPKATGGEDTRAAQLRRDVGFTMAGKWGIPFNVWFTQNELTGGDFRDLHAIKPVGLSSWIKRHLITGVVLWELRFGMEVRFRLHDCDPVLLLFEK